MAGVLNVLALFAVLAYYSTQMTPMLQDFSGAYLSKRTEYTWVTSVSWAWNEYGPWLTLAAAVALSAVLMALTFALAPNQHVRQSRYLKLPGSVRLRGILGPYDWCLLRSAQTVAAAAMALAVFAYLLLAKPSVNPMWGLAALSFGGLYQFTATRQLRLLPGAQEAKPGGSTYGSSGHSWYCSPCSPCPLSGSRLRSTRTGSSPAGWRWRPAWAERS